MIKRLVSAFAIMAMAATSLKAQDNSGCVQQGTNIIGLSIRLGLYNTVADNTTANQKSNGQAGDINYALSYERGINDRITIGGQFRYDGWILGKDTSAQQLNVAYGIDLDANAAFHFVRSQHVDLFIEALLGATYIRLADNNLQYQGVYSAGGVSYGFEVGARFYIGNHIGININIGYSGYDYPSGTAAGLGGYTNNVSLLFTGSTYGVGLCYKL